MASPFLSGKKSVNLTAQRVPGSRIRRDPPPVAKKEKLIDPEERDRRTVVFGVLGFTLALLVILIGFNTETGFSLSRYVIQL